MAIGIQVAFDAADPEALARFWQLALDYVEQPPPAGFADWQEFAERVGIAPEHRHDYSAAIDPDGAGPRLFFHKVPEGKVAKNRVHLDIAVSAGADGDEGWRKVTAHADKLVGAGATVLREVNEPAGRCLVMQDPEGNEFCLQ